MKYLPFFLILVVLISGCSTTEILVCDEEGNSIPNVMIIPYTSAFFATSKHSITKTNKNGIVILKQSEGQFYIGKDGFIPLECDYVDKKTINITLYKSSSNKIPDVEKYDVICLYILGYEYRNTYKSRVEKDNTLWRKDTKYYKKLIKVKNILIKESGGLNNLLK